MTKNGSGKKVITGIAIGLGTLVGGWFIQDAASTYVKARNINMNLIENGMTKEEHKIVQRELQKMLEEETNARILGDNELKAYFILSLNKYDTIMYDMKMIRKELENIKKAIRDEAGLTKLKARKEKAEKVKLVIVRDDREKKKYEKKN